MSYITSKENSTSKYNLKPGIVDNTALVNWLSYTSERSVEIHFPEGTWVVPINFEKNFGDLNVTISGVPGKTIITSYDGSPSTNFAMPEKIDVCKPKPTKDGYYQVEYTGLPYNASTNLNTHIHYDFRNATTTLGSYIKIDNGVVSNVTLQQVKQAGYVTELRVADNVDPGYDGIYIVGYHLYYSYGGGHTHLNLRYLNGEAGTASAFNTNNQDLLYIQGTVLKRTNGVWTRHYTGAGFASKGNMIVKDLIFDNCQFYILSPFDVSGSKLLSSSENFEVRNCSFKNCARVIGSSTYTNSQAPTNFWTTTSIYATDGRYRFKNLRFSNCEFSYIHTAIMWGMPPTENVSIVDNNIHDCYTAITCFYMFIIYYGATNYFKDKTAQNITGNSFINVRINNSSAVTTTTIMRTCGMANISNNRFINVNQQCAYMYGGNSTFTGNTVVRWMDIGVDTYYSTCVVLSKTELNIVNLIADNTIISPVSTLIAIEGPSNVIISNNSFIGESKTRVITSSTTQLEKDRIYYVKNISKFEELANTDVYNQAYVSLNPEVINYVFYNKQKRIWDKIPQTPPINFIFSKAEETVNDQQYVKIIGNKIECEALTRIEGETTQTYKYILVANNHISDCSYLHFESKSIVQDYTCSGNVFRNCSLNISSLDALTDQISTLSFENNKFTKPKDGFINLWAADNLIFRNNYMVADIAWENTDINNVDYGGGISPTSYYVTLTGATNSKIICNSNNFISNHTRFGPLSIVNPNILEIRDNRFNLNIPSQQTSGAYKRTACYISGTSMESIVFANNYFNLQSSKTNNLLEFDNNTSTITTLMVDKNTPITNTSSLSKAILATNKTITNFLKGNNFYSDSLYTIGSIGTTTTLQ